MTTIQRTIDEVLNESLHKLDAVCSVAAIHGQPYDGGDLKPEIKSALRQLIDEKLPKEDELIDDPNLYSAAFGQGYAKALADVKRALDMVFGEEQ